MEIKIPASLAGTKLLNWLNAQKYYIPADCGGKGTCGKCKVTVLEGEFYVYSSKESEKRPYPLDENTQILACCAVCTEKGATIRIDTQTGEGIAEDTLSFAAVGHGSGETSRYAFALDIGTTTLAGALVDTQSGDTVKTFSGLNPQKSYGADVISRIKACGDGHLDSLADLIQTSVRQMLEECARQLPDKKPDTLAVAGNPTMLHIFCRVSPQGMGTHPFTPVFVDTKRLRGSELGLPVGKVIVLPCVSAFLGSDIIGGVFAAGMTKSDSPSLLIDIGTNGEIVYCSGKLGGGRLLAASTAAGPALEGANITCGIGGVLGAISGMEIAENSATDRVCVHYRTVGERSPVGICGSGLIDLVAILLKTGIIDETGYLSDEIFYLTDSDNITFRHIAKDGSPIVGSTASSLYLTQKDVREFQLAKSAIRAGVETLLMHEKCDINRIGHIFLAGGLGYYMNPHSAAQIGLLPPEALNRTEAVGNTSLAGVKAVLCREGALGETETLAQVCRTYELNRDPAFSDAFMEYMMFPEN